MKPVGHKSAQRGFSLISAIFILVVLAFLTGGMIFMNQAQYRTVDYALQGARAHKAAYSGVQWGSYRVMQDDQCFADAKFNIDAFDVEVKCNWTRHEEGNVTDNCTLVFTIEAEASYSSFGQEDYVFRKVDAIIANKGRPHPAVGCN